MTKTFTLEFPADWDEEEINAYLDELRVEFEHLKIKYNEQPAV